MLSQCLAADQRCSGPLACACPGNPAPPPPQVEIINADTGAEAQNCDFITMRDLTYNITAPR